MKTEYIPDKWCVVKIAPKDRLSLYKVFGCWHGFYDYSIGDSWKLNSGITKVIKESSDYCFHGYSGSVYRCNEIYYGTTKYGASIIADMINKSESVGGSMQILPEETNWSEIDYENP